jgi:Flp pilus assembly protein TadD
LVNNYAYCLILRGELAKAREVLDKHKEESLVPLVATRGLLLIKEGNIQEGRRFYNRAVALAGNDRSLVALVEQKKNLELGINCLEKGNKREAIRLFQKGLRYKSREDRYKKKIIKLLEQLRD